MKRRFFVLSLICVFFVSFMAVDMVVADTAEAKSVKFINRHHSEVSVAVRYKDRQKGWMTAGWQTFAPGTTRNHTINTKNIIVYIYALSGSGKIWKGSHSDSEDEYFKIRTDGKPFWFVGRSSSGPIKTVLFDKRVWVKDTGVVVFE